MYAFPGEVKMDLVSEAVNGAIRAHHSVIDKEFVMAQAKKPAESRGKLIDRKNRVYAYSGPRPKKNQKD
jgi:hypothetical protein